MKQFLVSYFLSVFFLSTSAQDMKTFNLYKPEENAEIALNKAIKEANRIGKHVLIQIGGNWCVWCARFHEFVKNDPQLDSALKSGYIVYNLNYSKENINKNLMAKLGYPQRFGFPVFVVLDKEGKRIHTQNSAYLEQDKSYSKEKIMEFLNNWNSTALDPKQYINY